MHANTATQRRSQHHVQRRSAVALERIIVRQRLANRSAVNHVLQNLRWQLAQSKTPCTAQNGFKSPTSSYLTGIRNKRASCRCGGCVGSLLGNLHTDSLFKGAGHGNPSTEQVQGGVACGVRGKFQSVDIRLFSRFYLHLNFFLGLPAQCLDKVNQKRHGVLANLSASDRASGASQRTQRAAAQTTGSSRPKLLSN